MPFKSENRSFDTPYPSSQNIYISWLQKRYGALVKRRRKGEQPAITALFGLWSALAVSTVSVGFMVLGVWELPEQQSYNLMHQVRRHLAGAPHWDDRVVLIAMDDVSVKRKGFFPWNRDHHAELLQILEAGQPAAVVFDLFFPDETAHDAQFAEAIAHNSNVVLGVVPQDYYPSVSPSISQIAEGAFLRGHIGTASDEDGIIRRLPLIGPNGMPSLAMAAIQVYAQTLSSTVQADMADANAADVEVAALMGMLADPQMAATASEERLSKRWLDEGRSVEEIVLSMLPQTDPVWVSWPGETAVAREDSAPGHLQVYSYIDVLEGRVSPSRMQNKIVLVGVTTLGVDSTRSPIPAEHSVSGVHFFAAAINNLLNQSYLRRLPGWQCALLLLLLALGNGYVLRRQGVYQRLATVAVFPFAWAVLALSAFCAGWWIPVAAPIGTVLLGAVAVQLYEQQEKQQLMALFSMNVSSGTAELIWRHKGVILDQGELAAQTLTATVLFMDIRGFTGIAETLPTQKLLPWLNQYFETMTDCIMKHGGMVDKYIGDAIMAVFGAPLPRHSAEEIKDDAISALHAALEMHQRLKNLNHQLARQQLPTIKFGIGIHTGPLIGGTVGNRHRLNYSLFGDTVNIAARLESMTKALPADAPFDILLSSSTRQHTRAYFPMQPFQSCQLPGRTGLTDIYTIAASVPPADPLRDRTLPLQPPSSFPFGSGYHDSSNAHLRKPATEPATNLDYS